MSARRWRLTTVALLAFSSGAGWARAGSAASLTRLELLGEARLKPGLVVEGTVLAGLSGLTVDAQRGVFYLISDDPSGRSHRAG